MRRLCVFVFYDRDGIVSEYVCYLLRALKEVVAYEIAVVNGLLQEESERKLSQIADKVWIRENKGFDAGAYKDIFQNYLSGDELKNYDEIVLCNDSFYGPLYPFSELWNRMKNCKADFWGLTRHPEFDFGDGYVYPAHIQSYFLVVRSSLFLRQEFQIFWDKKVSYYVEMREAIKGFEIEFTRYFEEKGFCSAALTDVWEYRPVEVQYGENPYLTYSYELISRGECPVLKRKSLLISNKYFENALQAYVYISETTDYPEHLIENHIRRLDRTGNWCDGWSLKDLEIFCRQHENIYLYGAGAWGKRIQSYFRCRGLQIAGILISDGEHATGSEQIFRPDMIGDRDGIIVALGKENLQPVAGKLKKIFAQQQLFIPDYRRRQTSFQQAGGGCTFTAFSG